MVVVVVVVVVAMAAVIVVVGKTHTSDTKFLAKEEKSAMGCKPTKDRFTLRLNGSAGDD